MSDAAIRQAERAWRSDPTEDALTVWTTALERAGRDTLEAQVEALRVRAVPADRLTLAARLGDARAMRLVAIPASGSGGTVDWSAQEERRATIEAVAAALGKRAWRRVIARYVAWCLAASVDHAARALDRAEGVLPRFEAARPGDARPRKAIEHGRRLVDLARRGAESAARYADGTSSLAVWRAEAEALRKERAAAYNAAAAAAAAAYNAAYAADAADADAAADAAAAYAAAADAAYAAAAYAAAADAAAAAAAAAVGADDADDADGKRAAQIRELVRRYGRLWCWHDPARVEARSKAREDEHARQKAALARIALGEAP